jgi:hypothetical protein
MTHSPFQSTQQYQQHFVQQLAKLLQFNELGVFILVLANASMDRQIFDALKPELEKRFRYFQQQTLHTNNFPADDLNVFLQLQDLGLENVQLTQMRRVDAWMLQFNQLRSLRPARNSHKAISSLFQPFERQAFHFNKPFLAREIIWKGSFNSLELTLFYNKFPFADYHALALIDAHLEKPQYLEQPDCIDIDTLLKGLSHLKGVGFAYNSLGAYASVNHQHWQMILSQQPYAVELDQWKHNGGKQDYTVEVCCFDSAGSAWKEIESLQLKHQAFNLILRPHKTYLIKRKKQGEFSSQPWHSGLAWSELAGQFTLTRLTDFEQLDANRIVEELSQLKL